MRKHISFAFAAAAMGLAMIAWAKASMPGEDTFRPKVELPAPAAHPFMPFQQLKPLY